MASRSNARRRALGWLGALAGGVWGMSCLAGCTAARAEESTRAKQQKAALDVSERSRDVDAGSLVEPAWQIELGSAVTSVVSSGIVADAAGDVLVSGYTLGALEAGSVLASSDAFLAKYSAMGELRWAAALASADSDTAAGASTDSAGNVFIAGDTSGALDGAAQGRGDAFVARYSPEGALEWTRRVEVAPNGEDSLDLRLRRSVPVGRPLRLVVQSKVHGVQRRALTISADQEQ